jgi:RND superfamily putative drug exporter
VHAVPGAQALVGGETAVQLDTERATDRDNWVVMPLILGVIFLILVALLRALVAPLLLVASVVLSYAAALGAAGLILTALGHPKLFSGVPLQTFLFLVALGVDYTIFLMTRAREEVGARGHAQGVLHALAVTGGVITSAGLAATFAALGVLPLVPSVQIGVIVAVGVLLDTFLVRSLLVPALAVRVGPRLWWPGRPARAEVAAGSQAGVRVQVPAR